MNARPSPLVRFIRELLADQVLYAVAERIRGPVLLLRSG